MNLEKFTEHGKQEHTEPAEWEKIFSSYSSDQKLMYIVHKEPPKS